MLNTTQCLQEALYGVSFSFRKEYMSVDVDEFASLFETDLDKVKKVFPGAEEVKLVPKPVTWKGKTITVQDYELFVMTIKSWMKEKKWSKEQALDEFFSMS